MEGKLLFSVGEFVDARSRGEPPLTTLLELDLRALLAGVDGISVEEKNSSTDIGSSEKARDITLKYVITGIYRLEREGVRINAVLNEIPSGRIISSGRVIIRQDDLRLKDFQTAQTEMNRFDGKGSGPVDMYQFAVNNLLSMEPVKSPVEVEVWADKKVYQIGDTITFYFRSDRDTYITLIDIGTSGEMRVLFPNPFQKNNFVMGGQTYAIPKRDAEFSIKVEYPPGLERIKAIATETPLSIAKTDGNQFFSVFSKEDTKDMDTMAKGLEDQSWGEGYTEVYIMDNGVTLPPPGRERTIKAKKSPMKPIDIIGVPGAKPEEPIIEPTEPTNPIDITGTPGVK